MDRSTPASHRASARCNHFHRRCVCERSCCWVVVASILLTLWSGTVSASLFRRCIVATSGATSPDGERVTDSTTPCSWFSSGDNGSGAGDFFSGRGDEGGTINHDNRGDHVDVTDASQGDDPCADGSNPKSGNPIVLSTGDKIEPELDFESAGEMPLTLRRTFNHYWKYRGLFGKYWISSFDYSLVWQNSDALIFAQNPDGRRIKFIRVGVTNRWNEDKPSPGRRRIVLRLLA
jgi:hypothetical protein